MDINDMWRLDAIRPLPFVMNFAGLMAAFATLMAIVMWKYPSGDIHLYAAIGIGASMVTITLWSVIIVIRARTLMIISQLSEMDGHMKSILERE